MSTEETKLSVDGEADNQIQPANETAIAAQSPEESAPATVMESSPPPSDDSASVAGASLGTINRLRRRDDDDDDEPGSSDMDFGAMLEQYEQEQSDKHEGELVRGKIVGITERGIVIDFGYKSEGMADPAEFTEDGNLTVKVGDEVDVVVKEMDGGEGYPILSRADALRLRTWEDLEKAAEAGTPIKVIATERIKGGLRVDINGVSGFLPGSQIDIRPVRNLDAYKNQELEAIIIKFNRKRGNIVLSRKALLEEQNAGRKDETLKHIEEGIVVEGQIKSLTDYGAFVDLGGLDGLLHVTDMSWGRLQNPAEMFRIGDNVQVKVLKFDLERERVSLGYKQLQPDPWSIVEEKFPIGMQMNGKISSVTDYGAFVELEPGIEGLVHISEMTWSKRLRHPGKMVQPGQDVEVKVLGIDPKARRISLGMKQTQANPWDTLTARYTVGSRVTGRVRNLTDFGAFIEVEDGIDGLVHISDITWSRRIKHPNEVLKKGQEVEAVVTSIDRDNRRLSLSIKGLEPSAWDKFTTDHKPGDIVRGKVVRIASFGVFVELAEGLEGLCHISELSDDRIDKAEDIVKVGQEMDFRILRIESDQKKIGLSARAASQDESSGETKTYSSEAKSGMASLFELADLKMGGSNREAETPSDDAKDETTDSSTTETESVPETETAETEAPDENAATGDSEAAEASDVAADSAQSDESADNTGETAAEPAENSATAPEEAAASDADANADNVDETATADADDSAKADAESEPAKKSNEEAA